MYVKIYFGNIKNKLLFDSSLFNSLNQLYNLYGYHININNCFSQYNITLIFIPKNENNYN